MTTESKRQKKEAEELINELRQIGEFRKGSLNSVYRKCGKSNCVCNQEDHPGHGPQITLTYKEGGKSRIRNLTNSAEVELVREQIANHDRFLDWCRRWQEFKEKEADSKLEQLKPESSSEEEESQKKKLRSRSRKKSGGKSRS